MNAKEQFVTQLENVQLANGFGAMGEFEAQLAKMKTIQADIATRLEAAQAIVDELTTLVASSDWRLMEHWVKKYGR